VINPERLLGLEFPEIRHTFTLRDTMLYALGVGIGCDPLDPEQLRFVYEQNLVALPTMAVTLAYPGYCDLDTGLDHQRTVHASESITIHETVPVEGTVVARPRVIDVVDKGKDRGALVISERDICDAVTGRMIATVRQTAMCRGDGGFSFVPQKSERPARLPDRAPDGALTLPTSPQAALIYRLSGDPNPLHVDPDLARTAGFPRPVLHGLATMGTICHAAVRLALDEAPERLRTMDCRFTAPVYPGDAIACEFWHTEPEWVFRASVANRVVALGGLSDTLGQRDRA
jgi:acyl dehydratase